MGAECYLAMASGPAKAAPTSARLRTVPRLQICDAQIVSVLFSPATVISLPLLCMYRPFISSPSQPLTAGQ